MTPATQTIKAWEYEPTYDTDLWNEHGDETYEARALCAPDRYGDTETVALVISTIPEVHNLIAAAPDLLAACRRILRALEWSYTSDRMAHEERVEMLREVIAKAGG
jgi:hypothetical protein